MLYRPLLKSTEIDGQALTESIFLLPLVLFFVFGLLQMSQLGMALVLSQYAASSVARKAASNQILSVNGSPDLSTYVPNVKNLMVAGMTYDDLRGCRLTSNGGADPTAEMIVQVRTKIEAWPFFSTLVYAALKNDYANSGFVCSMDNAGGFGPFNFSQTGDSSANFFITGKAKVRLNYVP